MLFEKRKVIIWGKEYLLEFPLPGQILEIESLKNILTANQYGIMARTGTIETNYLLDLVDAIATFSVLIPEVKEKMPKKSYLELPLDQAKELILSYRKYYEKWYDKIRKEMMQFSVEELKDEENEGE